MMNQFKVKKLFTDESGLFKWCIHITLEDLEKGLLDEPEPYNRTELAILEAIRNIISSRYEVTIFEIDDIELPEKLLNGSRLRAMFAGEKMEPIDKSIRVTIVLPPEDAGYILGKLSVFTN